MAKTVVRFSLRVPMRSLGSRESDALDNLLRNIGAAEGVLKTDLHWTCLPQRPTDNLVGYLDLTVEIEAALKKHLQKLYEKLSREVSRDPVHLMGRTCSLNDMF